MDVASKYFDRQTTVSFLVSSEMAFRVRLGVFIQYSNYNKCVKFSKTNHQNCNT